MPEEMQERHLAPLPEGWERAETSAGIPYYLNHAEGTTHWEHPDMTQVFKELDGLNSIRYAAYRAAMKLRIIQKVTQLNMVNCHMIKQAFTELGMDHTHSNGVLVVVEIESALNKVFRLAEQSREGTIDPEKCTELALNWVLKCYDSGRTGSVKVRSLKVCTAALCSATLEEKYRFMFQQVSGGHVGISYSSLKILLKDLLLLTQSVSESDSFSPDHATDAVESCWNAVGNQPTDILNMAEFLQWLQQEPVSMVWLPTLHRLSTAETVRHDSKCSVCKAFPIVGFRYRCLKCTNVDLCQSCFWSQQTLKNHKVTHPTREYCLATTTGDDVRDFAKQMKNKLTRKYRHKPPKKSYLDHPLTERREEDDLPAQSPVFVNVHARIGELASRLQALEEDPQQRNEDGQTFEEWRARQELEQQVHELQSQKQEMEEEVRRLKEELAAQAKRELKPKVKVVKVPVPVQKASPENTVQSPLTPMVTPSPFTPHPSHEWSYILGAEEQEMATMVSELMAAFPVPSTSTAIASELGNELFLSARGVGVALSSVVKEIANTQDLSQ